MNSIELKNICKNFGDFKLDNINLSLPSGAIMGLVGENGAGKSTIINIILGMINSDKGEVILFGKSGISNTVSVKEDIGVVLDEPGIPEFLTCKEVGKVMSRIYRNWDQKKFDQMRNEMSLPLSKKFKDFSKGMKMKLSISIALSHNPKLLILDEATSGLDPVVRDEILDMFYDFIQDESHSILISSHIVSDLEKICDYITFIHKGKIILSEEKDMLVERFGVLKCPKNKVNEFDPKAVCGKRVTNSGAELLVDRSKIPSGFSLEKPSIEDIILLMTKGNR